MWVTQVADPDCYQLLFESKTDAPEEAILPTTGSTGAAASSTLEGVNDLVLVDAVRAEAEADAPVEQRAQRTVDLVRTRTGRRWVGVYRLDAADVVNLAWSGPAAPAYPRFPADRGLTSAAIESQAAVVSNDVANDPRYLTALDSTGSELIVPVLIRGRVVGTLDIEDERKDAFDLEDQALFEQLGEALTGLYR
jgi:L-methionine (R)-S-oxide reductase